METIITMSVILLVIVVFLIWLTLTGKPTSKVMTIEELKILREKHKNNPKGNLQHQPDIVRCPNCNSSQIQIVPRRWSLLNGFLTNKVDRVCLNCKTKF